MSNDRKIFNGFVGAIATTGVTAAVSFLQLRILVAHLSLEMAGIWILFLSIGTYVLFFDLGISPTMGREISFALGHPDLTPAARGRRIGTLIRSCTMVVAVLAVVVLLLGSSVGWGYLLTVVPAALTHAAHPAWLVFVAGAGLNLVGEGWYAGIYGLGHIFAERMVRAASKILGLVFMAFAIYAGYGFMGLAIAYLLQSACAIVMGRLVLANASRHIVSKGSFEMSTVRRLAGPSLKYALTLLGGMIILQTDNLVIASILGAQFIPDYQAVSRLVVTLMSLSMMLVVTSTPFISRAFAGNDIAEVKRLLNRNLRYSLSVMVVLGGFLACFADRVILLWLGPGHFVGFGIVWILLAVMLLECHHVAMAAATMATGKIVFFKPAMIAGALNIVFSILLARRWGLIGVAFGTLLAQVLTNNWYVPWYSMRQFHISLMEHARQVIFPMLGLAGLSLGAGAAARLLTAGSPTLDSILAGILVVLMVGLAYFAIVVLTLQDKSALLLKLKALRYGVNPA